MISIVVISRDEPALDDTLSLVGAQAQAQGDEAEVVVVDASEGRLDQIRRRHPGVRWIDFTPPPGVGVSIPHQRNAGVRAARGETIVFTDSGCLPEPGWLDALLVPFAEGEAVVAGVARAPQGRDGLYDGSVERVARDGYVPECPTINMAFRRAAFDAVGGFDEAFAYGSDIDYSWRLVDAGWRVRLAEGAIVRHDWGAPHRQVKRAFAYGRARARLYAKHRRRIGRAVREDPIVFAYPLFLIGLPLTARFRAYPLLLLVPAWRNRREGVVRTLADHLVYGAGVLREVAAR